MISKDELARWDNDIVGVHVDKKAPRFIHLTLEAGTCVVSFTKQELERLLKELGDVE